MEQNEVCQRVNKCEIKNDKDAKKELTANKYK